MLTCVQMNDGYQFELMVQVPFDDREITKISIGPYRFRKEYRPSPMLGGMLSRGGPESAFIMHKSSPPGWSRLRWETRTDEPDEPAYLTWEGHLKPGSTGVFRFISFYKPGGLRAGMIIWRGDDKQYLGVTGPNYERFEEHDHGH